ncbi:hypothetical protein KC367_g8653 [Hortaea werneckii]|nr:hypothetical protein KC361_g8658 [Hortaea werneckii]KAI6823138.1 hypothetical protein KC342_g12235 [Hortaea werneckii]KAI7345112.1 hypothetical protein KC320_g8492 [Hortaea werneckii]KAI7493311.1 hypothetical protein KC367_g8653 [Hortaea werneckii]KAI7554658.1 hypothetical protein KC331_g393 [Hortaea werneckii]
MARAGDLAIWHATAELYQKVQAVALAYQTLYTETEKMRNRLDFNRHLVASSTRSVWSKLLAPAVYDDATYKQMQAEAVFVERQSAARSDWVHRHQKLPTSLLHALRANEAMLRDLSSCDAPGESQAASFQDRLYRRGSNHRVFRACLKSTIPQMMQVVRESFGGNTSFAPFYDLP